jgi:hypothetical protein
MRKQKAVSRLMVYCVLLVCLVSFNASAGVIAYYSFDVDGADESGNGNDGAIQWDAVAGVADPNRALVMDVTAGADARCLLLESTNAGNWLDNVLSTKATIMMWAKIDSWIAATNYLFSEAHGFYIHGDATSGAQLTGKSTTGWQPVAVSNVDLADGKWHHWAATIDNTAGVYTLFLDGVEAASLHLRE